MRRLIPLEVTKILAALADRAMTSGFRERWGLLEAIQTWESTLRKPNFVGKTARDSYDPGLKVRGTMALAFVAAAILMVASIPLLRFQALWSDLLVVILTLLGSLLVPLLVVQGFTDFGMHGILSRHTTLANIVYIVSVSVYFAVMSFSLLN